MADIHNLFEQFDSAITLSADKQNKLRTSRDKLRTKIKNWFEDQEKKKPTFCWQGSFAMKTTVNPLDGNDYDIDDGVYLTGYSDKEQSEWPAPSTVHSWVKKAVEGHTVTPPVDKNTCVRVIFKNGYHIDYPIYILDGDTAYLSHKTEGWIVSDPKAFTDWFLKRVSDTDEQMRRLVRYLKAWKEYQDIPLKGIEVTILVAENYSEYEGRDEKSLYNTLDTILYELEWEFKCKKPVAPREDLFEDCSDTKKDKIMGGLYKLKDELGKAIAEKDPLTASEYMIKMFGDRFPKGEPLKEEKRDSFVRTKSPGVLRNDGRSA